MTDVATCSAPGCSEPGTHKCSSCKITPYCSVACQTVDWSSHKEECQGRLRKLSMAQLEKAVGFGRERNWTQSLRFCESALTCLMKLNPRSLEVIKIIDNAMTIKYNALNFMGQKEKALECAKERYSLWAAGHMRHHGMLFAAFPLIDGLLSNKEYEQAELIARTAYEMIINDTDNIIPEDQRQRFLAEGSQLLARAIHELAKSGGIAPDEMQKEGDKAIMLARKALEIHTQLHGTESHKVANDMGTIAKALKYFNGVDDDQVLRLFEQAKAIYSQVQGNLSLNVAICEGNLAGEYDARAIRAWNANDLDRCVANLELALIHYREAERSYRAINHVEYAGIAARCIADMEEQLIALRIARV